MPIKNHLISSQFLNLGGRWGTTYDVATIPFHLSLFSATPKESANTIPVHALMLSSHLFFCLPLLLARFTVLSLSSVELSSPCQSFLSVAISCEFPFLYHGWEIIMHSNSILDSVANFLVRHMVFEGNVQKSPLSSQRLGSFSRYLLSRSSTHRHKGRWIR